MRLQELKLRNFKGVRKFELRADGHDVTVYGDNATGKTTIADALLWVVFGKNSENRKDFGIKTLKDGRAVPSLEHEVEAVLDVGDGRLLSLRKVFEEVRTKKRGSATREFTGHTTNHFVDGVPVTAREFEQRVAELMDEGVFRLLTDPRHFNENLKWQERRGILLDVCGDVSDEDVIASTPDLADLPDYLGGRGLDDHRKVVVAARSKVNEELRALPVRIDEVSRGLPDVPDMTRDQVERGLASARAERATVETERAALKAGGADAAAPRKRLAEVEDAMAALEREARVAADEAQRAARLQRQRLTDAVAEAESAVRRLERERSNLASDLKATELHVQRLRDEWASVHARKPDVHTPDTCPACKQALPADRVQAAHDAALAQFNERKAAELERVQASGKEQAAQLAFELRELAEVEERLAEATESLTAAQAALGDAGDAPMPEPPDPVRTKPYVALEIEAKQLREQIKTLQAGEDGALDKLDEEAERLDQLVAGFEGHLATFKARTQAAARVAELEADEKRLAGEFESLERQLHLMDLFLRAKVDLLTERINARFEVVRFKLFDEQVNEGLRETCEATVDGVPYADLNGGARVRAGLDIINALADHYAFWPFIVLDNAESVTSLPRTVGQQIRLVVSEADKTLRVETAAPEEIAA